MKSKRRLGRNGPEVSAIGLGCMSFAGFFGEADDQTSIDCLTRAYEAGIDFWDTSNVYGMGRSESVIGQFIAENNPEIVLASKVGIDPGPPRRFNNDPDYIRAELEGSLKRLNRDYLDLYYIHRQDPGRDIELTAEFMASLIEEGLIRGYGLSEVAPGTIHRAHAVAPVMAVQNEYSLWTRLPDLGVIRACKDLGIAFVPFSPLARGMLADPPINPADMADNDWRRANPRFSEPNYAFNLAAIEGFRDFCARRGWTTPAAALAWVLQQDDHLIPIPGTRTADHLEHWLGADEIRFTSENWVEIDRLLPPGFAHGHRYSEAQLGVVQLYC